MKIFFTLFFIFPFLAFSQIDGIVLQKENNLPIVGAKIIASDGQKAVTGGDGKFNFTGNSFPITLITTAVQFANDTTVIKQAGSITILMVPPVISMSTVVVSAGKREQEIEEVPISMEIIKPTLIDNKGITDLEQAVDQSPGVFTMDGQVSIRGGSGFAYGTGSRVLLLWNGMPLLSGYAGDTQWNAIPMEQASQIEIMKGASSVLYGSGALNGVISLSEKEPGLVPETKVKLQYGIYDNAKRSTLNWWKEAGKFNPMQQQVEAYHSKMHKNLGYTISTTGFHNDGYREGESEYRARVSGTFYLRPESWKRLKAGISYNYQIQKTGNFLIWQSDTFAYQPSGGADTSLESSTVTYNRGQRLFIDPYLKYVDNKGNVHNFKTRVYFAQNTNLTNTSQSNGATVYFADYQFQRKYKNGITLTSGLSNIYNTVKSQLFGDHLSNNASMYGQYEHKIGKWDLSAGVRIEHFIMDGKTGDSDFLIGKDSSNQIKLPIYPVFRAGAHYELFKYTHLRASIGQGIRYPSVAERYTQTSVGALNIFPNPDLRPEKGWAAEIGVKQVVKMGEWKGIIDVAGFINQYSNMMEFSFGVFNPDSVILTPQNIFSWVGFKAQNAEAARITGVEFSFNSMGKLGPVEVITLIGYTYMNPITLNDNPTYLMSFSDTSSNMLKYRFKHLAKADVECNYKAFSFGFSSRYNSFMTNIDRVFEKPIAGSTYILPGLESYRKIYNKGNLVFDVRLGYKLNENYRIGLMVNNLFNVEVTSRPGDVQAPRMFLAQIQMKF
jgi:outer membrane receptor protein involved in Fe transport